MRVGGVRTIATPTETNRNGVQNALWPAPITADPLWLVHFLNLRGHIMTSILLPWQTTVRQMEYMLNKHCCQDLSMGDIFVLAVTGRRRHHGRRHTLDGPVIRNREHHMFPYLRLPELIAVRTDDGQMFLTVVMVKDPNFFAAR